MEVLRAKLLHGLEASRPKVKKFVVLPPRDGGARVEGGVDSKLIGQKAQHAHAKRNRVQCMMNSFQLMCSNV